MGIPPSKKSWRHGYGRLKQFVAREGHARVRYDFVTSDGFNLGPWMARQRNSYSEKRLNTEQVRALAVLPGRCWNLITDRWTVKYECLRGLCRPGGTYHRASAVQDGRRRRAGQLGGHPTVGIPPKESARRANHGPGGPAGLVLGTDGCKKGRDLLSHQGVRRS